VARVVLLEVRLHVLDELVLVLALELLATGAGESGLHGSSDAWMSGRRHMPGHILAPRPPRPPPGREAPAARDNGDRECPAPTAAARTAPPQPGARVAPRRRPRWGERRPTPAALPRDRPAG